MENGKKDEKMEKNTPDSKSKKKEDFNEFILSEKTKESNMSSQE